MTYVPRDPVASGADRSVTIDPRPRVLFASPVADLKGGAERVLLDLLDNPSVRPALAVPGEGELAAIARSRGLPLGFFDLGPVAAVRRPPRPGELLRAAHGGVRCARALAAIARASGASVIHTNGLKLHVIGALARLAHGVPVVAHVHDIAHTPLERAIWRGMAAGVTRMILVSRPCFPGGALPGRVAVVANGVRANPHFAQPRAIGAMQTVGFVGRFHPFKGVHLLLDWYEAAAATRPDLRLLIRGRADAEGAAYWQSLAGRIATLRATGRCTVLDWAGPGEDPYAGIDVLAVPSRTPDPAPLVIMEAMQRGIPVIGYPAGGIPGLIGGDAQGALAADAGAFAHALDRLLEPARYAAASGAAMRRVRETYSIERFWAGVNAQYARAGVAIPGVPEPAPS